MSAPEPLDDRLAGWNAARELGSLSFDTKAILIATRGDRGASGRLYIGDWSALFVADAVTPRDTASNEPDRSVWIRYRDFFDVTITPRPFGSQAVVRFAHDLAVRGPSSPMRTLHQLWTEDLRFDDLDSLWG